jgi:hypothetical protein
MIPKYTESVIARAKNREAVRSSALGMPLAEAATRTPDWQVLTILPNGWIEIDCNNGEERFVSRRTQEGKRHTEKPCDESPRQ